MAVGSANESIKNAISENKQKRDAKKQKKLEDARKELSKEGLLNDVPSMVTLPEFEQERMSIVSEQNDNLVLVLEEMQRLSERVDSLEKRNRSLQNSTKRTDKKSKKNDNIASEATTSPVMSEVIHLLGASLIWIVALFGADKYITDRELLLLESYPAEIPIWGIGATTWSLYLLYRIGKKSPTLMLPGLLRFQASLAVGITTTIGIMINDDSTSTVSSVWTWGTIIAIGLLLGSSMIASAWNSTKKLVRIK
jgi:polyhydroxyalkanoate synthesis regulator phasin